MAVILWNKEEISIQIVEKSLMDKYMPNLDEENKACFYSLICVSSPNQQFQLGIVLSKGN
jgi:hypothetical protein